eukprot:7853144-Pyramimonas_sp.AAC.1
MNARRPSSRASATTPATCAPTKQFKRIALGPGFVGEWSSELISRPFRRGITSNRSRREWRFRTLSPTEGGMDALGVAWHPSTEGPLPTRDHVAS